MPMNHNPTSTSTIPQMKQGKASDGNVGIDKSGNLERVIKMVMLGYNERQYIMMKLEKCNVDGAAQYLRSMFTFGLTVSSTTGCYL